jgi:hypothetical protein
MTLHIDLKPALVEALSLLGCDTSQYDFDDKSLIALHFRDVGDILVDPLEDGVWLWASLPEVPLEAFRGSAFDVLTALLAPAPYLRTDGLCLRGMEPQWQVGGPLRPETIENRRELSAAIEDFYLRVVHLREIVR